MGCGGSKQKDLFSEFMDKYGTKKMTELIVTMSKA